MDELTIAELKEQNKRLMAHWTQTAQELKEEEDKNAELTVELRLLKEAIIKETQVGICTQDYPTTQMMTDRKRIRKALLGI